MDSVENLMGCIILSLVALSWLKTGVRPSLPHYLTLCSTVPPALLEARIVPSTVRSYMRLVSIGSEASSYLLSPVSGRLRHEPGHIFGRTYLFKQNGNINPVALHLTPSTDGRRVLLLHQQCPCTWPRPCLLPCIVSAVFLSQPLPLSLALSAGLDDLSLYTAPSGAGCVHVCVCKRARPCFRVYGAHHARLRVRTQVSSRSRLARLWTPDALLCPCQEPPRALKIPHRPPPPPPLSTKSLTPTPPTSRGRRRSRR